MDIQGIFERRVDELIAEGFSPEAATAIAYEEIYGR